MKYRVVRQPYEKESGIACLATICLFYGIGNVSMAVLRNFAQIEEKGNSISNLRKVAEKLNFDTSSFSCQKDEMLSNRVTYPMIVPTVIDGMYNHYIVVFEANDEKLVLGDPISGILEMNWDDFEKIWNRNVILLKPTENFGETKKYRKKYKFLIDILFQFKKEFIILGILTTAISGISAVSAQFYSNLLDKIVPENSFMLLIKTMLGICGVLILTVYLNLVKQKMVIKFNRSLDKELVIKIYNRITNLPMSFFDSRTNGDINARYHDGDLLRNFILSITLSFIADIGYALWAAILIFKINWQMFVIAIVMEEIMILIQTYFKNKMEQLTRELIQSTTELDSFVVESFNASQTVKNYNAEKKMENEMLRKFSNFQDSKYKSTLQNEVQNNLLTVVNNIGNIFMLGTLGIFVMSNTMTVGELVKAYMYVTYLYQPVNYIIFMKTQFIDTSAALERLNDIFDLYTEEDLNVKRMNLQEKIEKIEFENISFRYGMKKPILKDISFKVRKGESIGIVGETGCGKTTLCKLILGFYSVTGGMIKINDRDINDYTTSSIRENVAYISQNDYWFRDTIYNNLVFGDRKIEIDVLDKVCRITKIDEFIQSCEHGYNTMLEEGASNLASGERQRLSIAKALIKNPDVLIMDESTSNVDAKTESAIIEQLRSNNDTIKIMISHRLNTIKHCDKIIVIDEGIVVESGKPEELLEQKGIFYRLCKDQKGTS